MKRYKFERKGLSIKFPNIETLHQKSDSIILIFKDVSFQFLTSDVMKFDAATPAQICQLTVETIILIKM
jgi:hypothetical protein